MVVFSACHSSYGIPGITHQSGSASCVACQVSDSFTTSLDNEIPVFGKRIGKLLIPLKRRRTVEHMRDTLGTDRVSKRRAGHVLGQSRSTQRRQVHVPEDEPRLVRRMIEPAVGFSGKTTELL